MRVYIIRHGESETNKESRWTGWLDVTLTEKGIDDARRAGRLLSDVEFDKLYSSDLVRAKMTLETALPSQDYEISTALREVNVGSIAGKPIVPFTDEEKKSMSVMGYATFDGETREEFRGRVESFMKMLEKSGYRTVGIFCHAGWQKEFLRLVLGVGLQTNKVRCKNCTVAIFDFNESNWMLHSWINL